MFHYFWEKTTLWRYHSIKKKILDSENNFKSLNDDQLKQKINLIRDKLNCNEFCIEKKLSKFLIPVYAIAKEVIFRKIGLSLFPTQIFGAIVLNEGNIAQMNTGEGKTLTAILPICLNALAGNCVYVVTANEYLANRDWEMAKPIFDYFEIPSAVNLNKYNNFEKKTIYEKSSIIYTTSSEIGFDYLKNNLVKKSNEKMSMKFDYIIADEIDSNFIDEAQNPLIISQNRSDSLSLQKENEEYYNSMILARNLEKDKDYGVDEKDKVIWLESSGIKKAEFFYKMSNLFEFKNQEKNFFLINCLKALNFYRKGIEYIVDREKKKIVIIDSLTGRLVPQRVYSSGIHQSIEAKEFLPVTPRGKSIAVITYQNFFRLFKKISGMTGTAKSEADEFREVYGMEVITIDPYKKSIRKDRNDLLFLNNEDKYREVIKVIKENLETKNRPILVGSPSLESSEHLSKLLEELKISHYKLNAINHHEEANIISKAGQISALTIATNMAGRGTDIILSPESIEKGGLLVIGLGRNFSRRLDNQLQGRAGRQGNPGDTQFYISLEDELLKNFFIKESIYKIFGKKKANEIFKKPVSSKIFDILVSEPQESIKNLNSSYRQYTLNYDLLINKQRKLIYNYRESILQSDNVVEYLLKVKMRREISEIASIYENIIKKIALRKTDIFWADYLEVLSKIRSMLSIKVYVPQNPQDAFFSESNKIFKKAFFDLKVNIKKDVLNFFSK